MCADIRRLRPSAIADAIRPKSGDRLIFSACAPCQPFSKQRRVKRRLDDRATLLFSFVRFVRFWKPHYIFVENVPGIQKMARQKNDFEKFVGVLERLGYEVEMQTVQARHYGVPQKRDRLVVMASRVGRIAFPRKTHGPDRARAYSTVWTWIRGLPKIHAGEHHRSVPNHWAANLSTLNQKRIRATPEGGGRRDWPGRLRLRCHRDYGGHTDVYGRMRKHAPAPGLTTRCISLSNGRFGHPTQDRAISVREAARLQTFDDSFVFDGTLIQTARQVGNAVPVLLAERFARQIVRHAKSR
jgi:DNA (cytosine-5)-methyltransferase 1